MANILYLVERYEINSLTNCEINKKNLSKIFEIMNKNIVSLKKIKETIKFNSENYNLTKKTFAIKNKDVDDFLFKINWPSSYFIIQNQTLLSTSLINYYIINYFEELTNMTHYAVIYSFDTSYFTDSFYSTIESINQNISIKMSVDNKNFALMFLLLIKYHFEQINTPTSKIDNILLNGHDYNNNHKLYKEIVKKIKLDIC